MSNKQIKKNNSSSSQEDQSCKQIVARLNRAQGQLGAVVRMFESGSQCQEIIYQISAVTKALDNAAIMLISSNLEKCILEGGSDQKEKTEQLKKLFLTIA
jgi:DNA-binding FrmR family transcriptional regulator